MCIPQASISGCASPVNVPPCIWVPLCVCVALCIYVSQCIYIPVCVPTCVYFPMCFPVHVSLLCVFPLLWLCIKRLVVHRLSSVTPLTQSGRTGGGLVGSDSWLHWLHFSRPFWLHDSKCKAFIILSICLRIYICNQLFNVGIDHIIHNIYCQNNYIYVYPADLNQSKHI